MGRRAAWRAARQIGHLAGFPALPENPGQAARRKRHAKYAVTPEDDDCAGDDLG